MSEPTALASLYQGHRFPPEVIRYAVWLYLRFSLGLRDVEELLAERGITVTYETVGQWVRKFGPVFAQELRRRGPRPGDTWHVDEVPLKINGTRVWLWRAVDQHGLVLDMLVQSRRDQTAAETFLRRVLGGAGSAPRVVITDKLASYPPAVQRVLPTTGHRRHKRLNNRAENSHLPTRQRERWMQRFRSPVQAQQFLEPFSAVHNHFRPRRHLLAAGDYRRLMGERFQTWRAVTALPAAH